MAVQLTFTAPQRSPGTRSGGRQLLTSCQPGGSWPLVAARRCTPRCAGPSGCGRRGLTPASDTAAVACGGAHRCSEDADRPSGLQCGDIPHVNAGRADAAMCKALLRSATWCFRPKGHSGTPSWAELQDKTLDLIWKATKTLGLVQWFAASACRALSTQAAANQRQNVTQEVDKVAESHMGLCHQPRRPRDNVHARLQLAVY